MMMQLFLITKTTSSFLVLLILYPWSMKYLKKKQSLVTKVPSELIAKI